MTLAKHSRKRVIEAAKAAGIRPSTLGYAEINAQGYRLLRSPSSRDDREGHRDYRRAKASAALRARAEAQADGKRVGQTGLSKCPFHAAFGQVNPAGEIECE
jgi:hypothetical protein